MHARAAVPIMCERVPNRSVYGVLCTAGPGDGLDGTRIASPAAQPLVYACSWWNADQAGQYLQDRSQPIWNSLSQGHVELYREVCGI